METKTKITVALLFTIAAIGGILLMDIKLIQGILITILGLVALYATARICSYAIFRSYWQVRNQNENEPLNEREEDNGEG